MPKPDQVQPGTSTLLSADKLCNLLGSQVRRTFSRSVHQIPQCAVLSA
ncbi:MAG: hypothetical protein H6696_17440 [Deferribacteres bacterium]|nr:hypothetical protein [Deferribacteres bacterium]